MTDRRRRSGERVLVSILAAVGLLLATGPPGWAAPAVATPTPTPASPTAPNPRPPRGGTGPDGEAVGGAELLSRGLVVPAGAPRLPAGLTAASWALTDLDSGAVLAARDAHGRYQPASILKVLTALVMLPRLPGSRVVTASADAANTEGSAVGLVAGGKYTVDTLFRSMLLMSGNDATTALAEAAGGTSAVVTAMNALARRLGAYDTFAQTPSGLDGWQQLTSAYDQSLILRAAMANPRLLAYDRALTATLPAQRVGTRAWGPVPLFNQAENFLTGVPGAIMAKTGFTDAAVHTYMCAAQRGARRLGVVFLRAQRVPTDQWQQAAALLNWGFALRATVAPVGTLNATVATSAPATPAATTSTATTSTATTSTATTSTASPTPAAAPSATSAPARARVGGAAGAGRSGLVSRWTVIDAALLLAVAVAVGLRIRRIRRRRRT